MSVRVRDLFMRELNELRYEPVDKRIRATLMGQTIVDTASAMLVWEPKRVVPSYAIPVADISARLRPTSAAGDATAVGAMEIDAPRLGDRPVLDPSIPFSVHTAAGVPVTIESDAGKYDAAGFRAEDAALSDYVIVDFDVFDEWYEEDERNLGHPRDPFHRIEVVHSSRHVTVAVGATVIAESSRPYLLLEPPLPVRYYLPAEDVRTDLLSPSETRTVCAYKGRASYWSLESQGDIAWSYPEPMREAAEITGRVAFFNEHVDLTVDGEPLARPVTPWS